MSVVFTVALTLLVSYLLGCFNGSVMTSHFIIRDDVRQHGSGNAGLTNFYRTYGARYALCVIICDMGKTVLACLIGGYLMHWVVGDWTLGLLIAGIGCELGHMFPVFFGLRGGKGILSGGVLVLLLLWGRSDAFTLSIMGGNGLSINLYTILFIAFFGIGYGAYYATADMPIPMVADCSDYETYRSGNYIPGIMGTLFSLVDKLVSSLSATVVGIAVSFIGLESLPTQYDSYTPGMNWVVIVLFCIIPMVAWAATLIAMKGYTLTGEKMKEIQAVNACRRDAVASGMKLEEAMTKWQSMDQLPAEYRS